MATGDPLIVGKDNYEDDITFLTRTRMRQPPRGTTNVLCLQNLNAYSNGLLIYGGPGGSGVTAYCNAFGTGVKAFTESGIAFFGETSSPGPGTVGIGVCGVSKSGVGVWGEAGDPTNGFAGIFNGILRVNGDLEVYGAKSAVVPLRDGSSRRVYSIESPESWLEDFGEGQLRRGRATVTIDRRFATLIRRGYQVFLTPYGDCTGLYVSRRTSVAFEVREQGGATNTLAFGYRIVGKRRDVNAERLAKARPNPKLERPKRERSTDRRGTPRPR
jgi:hypothetical protein